MRPIITSSAMLLSLLLTQLPAEEGGQVQIALSIPDAVKAALAKDYPDAVGVKIVQDKSGKTVYHVKTKDTAGEALVVVLSDAGTMISKHRPKDQKEREK